jgi:hypothetical protein
VDPTIEDALLVAVEARKRSDLADNLANNRALPPSPDNLERIARYERALQVLGPIST